MMAWWGRAKVNFKAPLAPASSACLACLDAWNALRMILDVVCFSILSSLSNLWCGLKISNLVVRVCGIQIVISYSIGWREGIRETETELGHRHVQQKRGQNHQVRRVVQYLRRMRGMWRFISLFFVNTFSDTQIDSDGAALAAKIARKKAAAEKAAKEEAERKKKEEHLAKLKGGMWFFLSFIVFLFF